MTMIDVADRAVIALVRLSHGKVNALDLELVSALPAAMEQAAQASAVVLTGAGRAFSAGVDLARIVDNMLLTADVAKLALDEPAAAVMRGIERLDRLPEDHDRRAATGPVAVLSLGTERQHFQLVS